MRFISAHYPDVLPASLTSKDIINYINHIVKVYGVGRGKCHQVAQSCSFFYKHVMPSPFIVPSQFYPRKEFKLPKAFSVELVQKLLSVITNPKHRMMISLFYGTGVRLNELRNLKLCDIDSKSFQIKVVAGNGRSVAYVLLSRGFYTST